MYVCMYVKENNLPSPPPSYNHNFFLEYCYILTWASQEVLLVKNPPANIGDIRNVDLIPGLGRSPGGGHGNSLQYSCLQNPMDRGAWWAMYSPQGHKELAHAHPHLVNWNILYTADISYILKTKSLIITYVHLSVLKYNIF